MSLRLIALSKSWASIALATSFVSITACISGLRTILFSMMAMKGVGVDGVASRTAFTASIPCRVDSIRSYAQAFPPLWTCPRVETLVSMPSFVLSASKSLTSFAVILVPF